MQGLAAARIYGSPWYACTRTTFYRLGFLLSAFFFHIPTLLATEGLFSDTLVLCVHYHRFARELSYFWNIPGSFREGGVGTGIWAHWSRYSMLQRQALKRPLPSWGWIFGRKLSVCLHIALSFPLLFFLSLGKDHHVSI